MTIWRQWLLRVIYLVNKVLDLRRVTSSSKHLLFAQVRDVFETVYFSKSPEHIILIFTSSFDLEFGSKLWISWQSIGHSI